MKFEVLKPNKIKVIVEKTDLEKWGVTADDMAKNSPEVREIFFEMLRIAEKETGFSCNNSRLVVEAAIRSDSDELTLFVTKVASNEEKELFDKISSAIAPEKKQVIKNQKEEKKPVNTMVELTDFEDVIKMCYAMRECMWGSLFSYNDKYYMTMLPEHIKKASEFGDVCPESYRSVVEEHGTPVIRSSAFLTIRNRFKE